MSLGKEHHALHKHACNKFSESFRTTGELVNREQFVGRLRRLHDNIEDFLGYGAVKPGKNCEVLLSPVAIGRVGRGAVDVVLQAELADHDEEERALFGVVRSLEIESPGC